jgi:uncharacterized protein involved in type VI secretion and phage assembly
VRVAERRALATPVLTVDGRELAGPLYPRLRQVRVEESVQLPDRIVLRFEDATFRLFDSGTFTLGTRLEIAFRTDREPVAVSSGEVTAIGVEQGVTGHHELVVTALDLGHRLGRTPRTRTFTHMSDAAIARTIAQEYGLEADVHWPGEQHPYVLQAGRTDWAFLTERAARTGHSLWVTGRILHVASTPAAGASAPALRWGENLQRFSARFTAMDRCDEVVVHGWDGIAGRAVRGSARATDPLSSVSATERFAEAARTAFGRESRDTGRHAAGSPASADALAMSLLTCTPASGVVLRGEAAGDPRIGAGMTVRLEGVGEGLSGEYRLTEVEHRYGGGSPYMTRFVAGGKEASTLVDLLTSRTGGPFAAAGAAPTPPLASMLLIGEVTNTHDDEQLARVRVRFPTLSMDDESWWARLAVPGGGSARGMQWLPEVGDEVLVGFEFGDLNRPVVLGGLWSRSAPPPERAVDRQGRTTTRVLASRTNSRLELIDDPTGRIRLGLGKEDIALTLTADESAVDAGKTFRISADRIVLDGKQIEITSDGDVTVRGRQIKLN